MAIEHFTNDDFDQVVDNIANERRWKSFTDSSNGELCYLIELDAQTGVKIRSTIKHGVSGGPGMDSIRVYPIHLATQLPLGPTLERWIQRTSGWREHLTENVETFARWREIAGDCPRCKSPKQFAKVKKLGPNTGRPFGVCFDHFNASFIFLDVEAPNERTATRNPGPVLETAGNVTVAYSESESHQLDPMRAFIVEPHPGGTGNRELATRSEDLSALFESLESGKPISTDAPINGDSDCKPHNAPTNGRQDAGLVNPTPGALVTFSVPPVIPPSFRILPSDITPSQYQRDFYYACSQGDKHTVLIAVAGSGKTKSEIEGLRYFDPSLSVGMAAFNRTIAKAAQAKAPANVKVGTFHSLALAAVMKKMPHLKLAVGGDDDSAQDKMDIVYNMVTQGANRGQKYLILRLVALCKNMLMEPSQATFDWLVDRYSMDIPSTAKDLIYDLAERTYNKSIEMNSSLVDFNDLIWLVATDAVKVKPFDRFLVDEAQDMDPAQIQMALRMGKVIYGVGDPNQCQPAGTLIATCIPGHRGHPDTEIVWKPIESLVAGDSIVALDRHGHTLAKSAKVNAIAKRQYAGRLVKVSAGGNESHCTPNHEWIVRWNKDAENKWCTYLMQKGQYFRVGVTAMFRQAYEYKNNLAFGLGQRSRQERADAAWILKVHDTKQDAALYEQILTIKYGLPQVIFYPVHNTVHFTQSVIDQFYKEVGNLEEKARICLAEHGREFDFPLYNNRQNGGQKRQGRNTIFETQACNLISDYMLVPTLKSNFSIGTHEEIEWHPVSISTRWMNESVYSLDVATHHNYVADGIVTCNSIYSFRGADSEAMPKLIDALDATVLPLSICYRCPQSSIRLAQQYVPQIQWREGAPEGVLDEIRMSKFDPQPGDLNISRVNSALIKPCLALIRRGIKAAIVGRDIGKGIRLLLDRGQQMAETDNLPIILQTLLTYTEIEVAKLVSVNKMTRADFLQEQFDCLVAISDACTGLSDVQNKIAITFSDQVTPIRFSSVHRAKGLEANNVNILKPQLLPMSRKNQQPWEEQQERNVTYVAYTRNKQALHFVLDA